MTLTKEYKQQLFTTYGANPSGTDSGSASVQIAIFTNRIAYLTEHLKQNPKDRAARLGLVKLVGKRSNQLNYLYNNKVTAYRDILKKLKLRG